MTGSSNIFNRQWLRPSQLRTVAERRFADAYCLRQSNQNERANGVMYLAGFVIECLLKAKLLERFPWLQRTRSPAKLSRADHRVWSLCYRSHNLDEILLYLPDLPGLLIGPDRDLLAMLRSICGMWTVYARYSPNSATMAQAAVFLANVKEIKKCLK